MNIIQILTTLVMALQGLVCAHPVSSSTQTDRQVSAWGSSHPDKEAGQLQLTFTRPSLVRRSASTEISSLADPSTDESSPSPLSTSTDRRRHRRKGHKLRKGRKQRKNKRRQRKGRRKNGKKRNARRRKGSKKGGRRNRQKNREKKNRDRKKTQSSQDLGDDDSAMQEKKDKVVNTQRTEPDNKEKELKERPEKADRKDKDRPRPLDRQENNRQENDVDKDKDKKTTKEDVVVIVEKEVELSVGQSQSRDSLSQTEKLNLYQLLGDATELSTRASQDTSATAQVDLNGLRRRARPIRRQTSRHSSSEQHGLASNSDVSADADGTQFDARSGDLQSVRVGVSVTERISLEELFKGATKLRPRENRRFRRSSQLPLALPLNNDLERPRAHTGDFERSGRSDLDLENKQSLQSQQNSRADMKTVLRRNRRSARIDLTDPRWFLTATELERRPMPSHRSRSRPRTLTLDLQQMLRTAREIIG